MRFTAHALDRMDERKIGRDAVAEVVSIPDSTVVGTTAIEYTKVVQGRQIHVVVARDSDPPLVITVMLLYD